MGLLEFIGLVVLGIGCGTVINGRRDGGEDVDGTDGGTDVDGGQDVGDGGEDLTKREGVNDRWQDYDGKIVHLNVTNPSQKLHVLLEGMEGSPNRLVPCNLANQSLEKTACEDPLTFPETPLFHSKLDDRYSAVTFNTNPDNHPGFLIVDRGLRRISDQITIPPFRRIIGTGAIEYQFRSPAGAILFGGSLLVAAENCLLPVADLNNPPPECTSWSGTVLKFGWNGDGTFSDDMVLNREDPFFATHSGSNLFWKRSDDVSWLWNNGSSFSSFDILNLNGNGELKIDRNELVGTAPMAPFKRLPINIDTKEVLLAKGHELTLVKTEGGVDIHSYPWNEEGVIVSAQWFDANVAFVIDSKSKIFRMTFTPDRNNVSVSSPLPLFGVPTDAVLDLSACILYVGLSLPDNRSAITAIKCDVLTNL